MNSLSICQRCCRTPLEVWPSSLWARWRTTVNMHQSNTFILLASRVAKCYICIIRCIHSRMRLKMEESVDPSSVWQYFSSILISWTRMILDSSDLVTLHRSCGVRFYWTLRMKTTIWVWIQYFRMFIWTSPTNQIVIYCPWIYSRISVLISLVMEFLKYLLSSELVFTRWFIIMHNSRRSVVTLNLLRSENLRQLTSPPITWLLPCFRLFTLQVYVSTKKWSSSNWLWVQDHKWRRRETARDHIWSYCLFSHFLLESLPQTGSNSALWYMPFA